MLFRSSKIYGQSDPVFVFTASPALLNTDRFTGSLSRTTGETVGSYGFTAGSLSAGGNYSISINPSAPKFAVTPRPLTITANDGSKTYGEAYPFTGWEFVATGLINGNTVTSVTLASPGASATASTAGSPYPIVVSGAFGSGLENYSITYVNGILTVGTLPVLTVSAANKSKVYGTAYTFDPSSPSADFTVTGLKNGDAVTGITIESPGADLKARAGSYAVTPSSAQGTGLENYTIVYTPGTFTVTPAMVTVNALYTKDKCEDGTMVATLKPFAGQSLSGVITGDVLTLQGTAVFDNAVAGTGKPVTVSGLILGGADGANYHLTATTATSAATIHPRPLATAGADRSICAGQSTTLGTGVAGQSGAPGNTYAWSSSGGFSSPEANPTVAPAADATYSVVRTSEYGCVSDQASVTVRVNALPAVSGTLAIGAGFTTQLTGTGTPSATNAWSSGNMGVATVDNTGLVTGVGQGSSVITYTTASGCTATATVTVSPSNIITGTLTVCTGSSTQLAGLGTAAPENTWVSATPGVATVSSNGLVTGVAAGSCGITYTLSSGYSQTVTVTVSSLPVISGTLSLTAGSTSQLSGSPAPASANPWSSAATRIATVSSSGLVTGISAGVSDITYTNSHGCTITATATILPATPSVIAVDASLQSSASQGNQWYYSPTGDGEGSAIPGATAPSYTPDKVGWYWTVVTQGGNSSEPSLRKYRLSSDSPNMYNLYPVPNDGQFTLSITTTGKQIFDVTIYTKLGQKVYELHDLEIDGQYSREINLRPAASGVYLIIVQSEQEKQILKMNVEN